MNHNQPVRVLAIAPTSRGFGYVVMEGPRQLISYGNKTILRNKNARALVWVDKFIRLYQPNILMLPDVNAKDTHRAKRIKELHHRMGTLARTREVKLTLVKTTQIRERLTGASRGTKQAMAEKLAEWFPDELQARLPPKRRPWMSEDPRMDLFDAVGLAMTFWPSKN